MGRCRVKDARHLVKHAMARGYWLSGLVERRLGRLSGSAYPILMYHRVLPEGEAEEGLQPGMYVTPETFEAHVAFLKQRFSIVSLEAVISGSLKRGLSTARSPICVLTFDDGWIDFYKHAFPILKRNRSPATVFLPTAFIGKREMFWTDRLTALVSGGMKAGQRPRSRDHRVQAIEALKGPVDAKIEAAISLLKYEPPGERDRVLSLLNGRWGQARGPAKRVFVNWREVDEMRGSGLVSFGSHTHRHNILTVLSRQEVAEELAVSMARLGGMNAVDSGFIPFCYPNGNWNGGVAAMVKECGFAAALTTEKGWNRCTSDVYRLKRVPVHQDMACSKMMFGCRLAGLL